MDDQARRKRENELDLVIAQVLVDFTEEHRGTLPDRFIELSRKLFCRIESYTVQSIEQEQAAASYKLSYKQTASVIESIAKVLTIVAKRFEDYSIEEEMDEDNSKIA